MTTEFATIEAGGKDREENATIVRTVVLERERLSGGSLTSEILWEMSETANGRECFARMAQ